MRLRKRKKSYIDVETQVVDVDNLLKDTTRTERFQVFEALASIRKYLTVLLMVSGTMSAFFSVQFLMGIQIFSSPLAPAALAAIGFIGVANILCGLLLLGSE
ncbi:hypothetical protein G4O51_10395 [Candidatus Bathyarchaeota archaeon A05DMB-2]|jgi:hypothetical protein|nr:hypothetical protein [Candidatus Bathyarchaeota archaeon A05DMB-2]